MKDVVSTSEWLTMGGDQRIVCNEATGMNAYGCPPMPQPNVLAFGSATASTISTDAFAAAERLLQRLPQTTYAKEMERIRQELWVLCGFNEMLVPDIVFAASGTDVHLFAGQLIRAPLVVMIEPAETGGSVPNALQGMHFSTRTAFREHVIPDAPVESAQAIHVTTIPCRKKDGNPYAQTDIDAQVEATVSNAVTSGQKVLLIVTDGSKTGLLVPSPACAASLKQRYASMVEILVDACQFRLAPATIRAYVAQGFMVAITGSKFIGGPAFSGALFIPQSLAERLRAQTLPKAFADYSTAGDWPQNWNMSSRLPDMANTGLLLRWEAALYELHAFHALPETTVAAFIEQFATAINTRMQNDPAYAPLPTLLLDRTALVAEKQWDHLPTIFPFLLRKDGLWLNREETRALYEQLHSDDIQLGQPVLCGMRDGIDISALRLCLSARLIVDAVSPQGRGRDAVIAEALVVLDRITQKL